MSLRGQIREAEESLLFVLVEGKRILFIFPFSNCNRRGTQGPRVESFMYYTASLIIGNESSPALPSLPLKIVSSGRYETRAKAKGN